MNTIWLLLPDSNSEKPISSFFDTLNPLVSLQGQPIAYYAIEFDRFTFHSVLQWDWTFKTFDWFSKYRHTFFLNPSVWFRLFRFQLWIYDREQLSFDIDSSNQLSESLPSYQPVRSGRIPFGTSRHGETTKTTRWILNYWNVGTFLLKFLLDFWSIALCRDKIQIRQ